MMRLVLILACLIPLYLAGLKVARSTEGVRLDDSTSPRTRIDAPVGWANGLRESGQDPQRRNRARAEVPGVEIRLDTRAYRDRDVAVYIRLQEPVRGLPSSHSLEVRWQSRGRFSPGTLVSGQRSPLFIGRIDQDWLSDVLDLQIEFDARDREGPVHLEFEYEIDLR